MVDKRHQRAVGRANVVVEQLLRIEAEALLHLRDDLIGASAHAEIVDVGAAQHGGERAADVAHLQAELRSLVAVDQDVGLRIVDFQIAIQEDEQAALLRLAQKLLSNVVQALERLGRADHELNRQSDAARQRRRLEGDDTHTRNLRDLLLHDRLQLVSRHRAAVPRFQRHAGNGLPRHVDLKDVVGLGMLEEDPVDLVRIELALLERRIRRRIRQREDDALILLRRELGMGGDEQEIDAREHDQRENDGDRQVIEASVQAPLVGALQPIEAAIDDIGELLLPAAMLRIVRLEQQRAQHRRQRQRYHARDGHRANESEREFGEQRAGQTALKADRHVNRGQHHRHGDDRPAELARGIDGGRNRRHAFLEMAVDVLDHDDGVVDDEADAEHQREQREQIDRVAERQKNRERSDQRQRNGDRRYQRRTHRSEEHEHHERDDDQRLDQAEHDLVDRGIHEFGGVVDDLAVQAARQLRLDVRPDLAHAADHFQKIGGGRDLHADIDRLLAVEAHFRFIILGAEGDVGDVLQADHRAVRLLDDEIAELACGMKPGRCGQVDLHHLALGVADARDEVVGRKRRRDISRG